MINTLSTTASFSRSSIVCRRFFRRWSAAFLAVALLCFAGAAPASAQTAQWVKQMGTGGISNGVSSDAAGNAYATGSVSNPGLFDSLNIPCNAADVFLAKYDAGGNVLWATIGGGALLDQGNDVVTDANGNSYVVGAIQTNAPNPTPKFGSFTLVGNGDYDWLIVKYDALGNVVWAKNYGSTAGDTARGVAFPGAASYSLQYRQVGTTRWKTNRAPRTSVKLKNLLAATSYEVQVATVCSTETSPYSPVQVFTTKSSD